MKLRDHKRKGLRGLGVLLAFLTTTAPGAFGQPPEQALFQPEELEQVLAPIALYPDSLLAQVLMASTYPLEIVQADRWTKQNKELKGGELTGALEKQNWDPSVKSLVNFPPVLSMMSEKLDWTQKLGDAFLAQQKEVMESIQRLRKKAVDAGTLKTTAEQQLVVEKETIVIAPSNPQVVYVPTYNPTVVYGTWSYPAYPPAYYYPPGYTAGAALLSFGAGMAVGAAWGYAWGNCNWHGGDVDVDVNRNTHINNSINRGKYATQYQGGKGNWQHNPEHRKGVAYRDQATGQKYHRVSTDEAVKSREKYRGRTDSNRQEINRGGAERGAGRPEPGQPREGSDLRASSHDARGRNPSGQQAGAFSGMDRGGGDARNFSNRGSSSRQSMSAGGRGGGGRR